MNERFHGGRLTLKTLDKHLRIEKRIAFVRGETEKLKSKWTLLFDEALDLVFDSSDGL